MSFFSSRATANFRSGIPGNLAFINFRWQFRGDTVLIFVFSTHYSRRRQSAALTQADGGACRSGHQRDLPWSRDSSDQCPTTSCQVAPFCPLLMSAGFLDDQLPSPKVRTVYKMSRCIELWFTLLGCHSNYNTRILTIGPADNFPGAREQKN